MATVEIKLDRLVYFLASLFVLATLIYETVENVSWMRSHLAIADVDELRSQVRDSVLEDIKSDLAPMDMQPSITCETIVQQPLAKVQEYTKLTRTDAIGGDLFPLNTKRVDVLRKVCDAIDECRGFNSNGWLKKHIGKKYTTSTDLHIKQSQAPDEEVYLSLQIIEENYGRDYVKMTKDLRIFIYPTKLDAGIKSPNDYKYGVEQLFIDLLKESSFVTEDPEKATFFLLPFRCTAYRKTIGDMDKAQLFTEDLVHRILSEVQSNYPYWNRSLGADHCYVCAHDMGASSVGSSDPNLHKNAIALVNTADYGDQFYIPHKDICLPPHPAHGDGSLPVLGHGGIGISPTNRTVLAFFAGNLDRGRIRPSVKRLWSQDEDFRVFMGYMNDDRYQHYLRTSKFCLILRGNRAWTPRLMDAVWFGCVPVIMSDHYDLPLQGLLDWSKFAVFVMESEVDHLKSILQAISANELDKLQYNIRQIYAHFVWNDPPRPYDSFHSVLYQLWRRRGVVRYKPHS